MKEKLRHYFSVYGYKLKLEVRHELDDISWTFCWLLMIPLSCCAGFYVLWVILEQGGGLNGWGSGEAAFLFGLSMFSHGLQDLFFIRTRSVDELIRFGEFDRMLLMPLGLFGQFCMIGLNICGLYDLVPAAIIFAWGSRQVGFVWSAGNILGVLLVIAGGTMISLAFYTVTGCLAFWFPKSSSLEDLNLRLIEKMSAYPLTIYPQALQAVFTFLVPLGFISFYPACGFLGMDSGIGRLPLKGPVESVMGDFPLPAETPLMSLAVGAVCLLIARAVFLLTLKKRYDGSSSV